MLSLCQLFGSYRIPCLSLVHFNGKIFLDFPRYEIISPYIGLPGLKALMQGTAENIEPFFFDHFSLAASP